MFHKDRTINGEVETDGYAERVEYFVNPDMVICENGIDRPRKELQSMVPF